MRKSTQLGIIRKKIQVLSLLLMGVATVFCAGLLPTQALADTTSGFSLQVSPSPLVATVQPGKTTDLQLHIRNTSDGTQDLKMGLRAFTVDSTTGQIKLETAPPKEVADFVSFANPKFSVESGALYDQDIAIAVPASAGFTYSFAITISQQHPTKSAGKTAINGSVAVFTLLNVDKPGATRKVTLTKLSVSQHVYEYLPAAVSVTLKNSGNTLAQPKGTIYIQRHSADAQPLAVINLNASGGYILPASNRTLTANWNDGFPHYKTVTDNGKIKQQLSWQVGNIGKLRIGRYVAKVVAVYDDGGRDVPLNAEVTFWVIPWRLLLIALVIVLICVVGAVTIIRKSSRVVRRPRKQHDQAKKDKK